MTENRQRTAMRPLPWLAFLLAGVLLQGCGNGGGGAGGSRLRVYAADLTGAAKSCNVQPITPASDQTTNATMKLANDGGWCGLSIHQDGPQPFDAGLLTARPAHGTVLIHEVGDETRIDYTPDRGFSGVDSFTVKLVPGNGTVRVAVTVSGSVK